MSERSPSAWPIFGVFFIESVALGLWIPRIPDIKNNLALTDSLLGVALLCMPIGTMLGLALAGRVIDRLGLRETCRVFLPIWSLLFLIPAAAGSLVALGLGLALAGFAVGMIETAMNTEAARQENTSRRRLMSRCHGFWSLGSMSGALLGGLLGEAGISVARQSLILMPIVAILGVLIASALPTASSDFAVRATTEEQLGGQGDQSESSRLFRWPATALLPLCCMPLGVMMVEGAFIDWSAVYAREVLEASPLVVGVIYAAFASVMAVTRLSGDMLGDRFGDVALARASGVAAVAGIAGFALAPNVAAAFFAAAVAGAGVAVVFPLAVSAVARRHTPGRSAADNVAGLNMISFSAFLFAPPLIGFLSDATNLRIALLALVPGALVSLYLTRELMVTGSSDQA